MINKAKLNQVHNMLKELVGEHGAFVLIMSSAEEEGGEDFQIRMYGPTTRRLGALSVGEQFINKKLRGDLNASMTNFSEPD